MSVSDVVGAIARIIAILEATAKICSAMSDVSGLPEGFRDVANRMPLVRVTLDEIRVHVRHRAHSHPLTTAAITTTLASCEEKANKLGVIFRKAVPDPSTSLIERPILAMRTVAESGTVQRLMDGIEKDIGLLGANHVLQLSTASQTRYMDQFGSLSSPEAVSARRASDRDALLEELGWGNPRSDRNRIERMRGGLYDAASDWILSHPSYQQWKDEDANKLLWIKGGAGKGKTMLLITVLKQLEPPARARTDPRLAFFFCQNKDNRLNNAVAVLKGLIFMLLDQDCDLVMPLKNHCDRMGKDIFYAAKHATAFDNLASVFRETVRASTADRIYLAVDALDECCEGQSDLIELISHTSIQHDNLKWVVTSRNQVNVSSSLALSLEVHSESVQQGIEAYISYKVSQIQSLRFDPFLARRIQQRLIEKADGTFLWVDLCLRSVEDDLCHDLPRRIEETPKGLTELYQRMMDLILASPITHQQYCLTILSVVTLAYRPLHLLELQILAGLTKYRQGDLERIINMCGSFLVLQRDYIYPIHQSATDYLVSDAALTQIFPKGKKVVHRIIVDNSLESMSMILRRDIYQLEHPGTLIDEVSRPPPPNDPLLAVGYSCAYWIDHTCEIDSGEIQPKSRSSKLKLWLRRRRGSSQGSSIYDAVALFIQGHFLHWLEAMSLLQCMGSGVLALKRLQVIVEASQSPESELARLIADAHRFLLHNRLIISEAPLQTYGSALLFSPNNSLVRRIFSREEPSWVLRKPLVEDNWTPCLQVLYDGPSTIVSIAFCSDGSRIASLFLHGTIRIWETDSGRELHSIEIPDHPDEDDATIVFSSDDTYIASKTSKTIHIWLANRGTRVQSLQAPDGEKFAQVALICGCNQAVSISDNLVIRTWDIETGRALSHYQVPGDSGTSLGISPDGCHIAWCRPSDKTTYARGINSRHQLQIMEGYNKELRGMVFSQDSQWLMSLGTDYTIGIGRVSSDKVSAICQQEWAMARPAISPDGSLIATVVDLQVMQIRDAKSGNKIGEFEDKAKPVRLMRFSPDRRRFASISTSLKVWDLTLLGATNAKDATSLQITSAVSSPNGHYFALHSNQGLRIWEAGLDEKDWRQYALGNYEKVCRMTFSPDSSSLAIAGKQKPEKHVGVAIWDLDSGCRKASLGGYDLDGVSTVTDQKMKMSQYSTLIGLVSEDRRVQIWDVGSNKIRHTIAIDDSLWAWGFSPDESYVAVTSFTNTMDIYETRSGRRVCDFKMYNKTYPVSDTPSFSPDSRYVAVILQGHTCIWEWSRSQKACKLQGLGQGDTESLAFSPDGKQIILSCAKHPQLQVWDLEKRMHLASIEMGRYAHRMCFEVSGDPSIVWLRTNARSVRFPIRIRDSYAKSHEEETPPSSELASALILTPEERLWHLDSHGLWICFEGCRMLRIPSDYERWSDVLVDGSSLLIGDLQSRRIAAIRLSLDTSLITKPFGG